MSAPVQEGDVLAGKYRIERILGQGGMGVVAAAMHLKLDELVAIKFLLPDALKNPGILVRFEREAKAQVKIKSEHVARTIDVGQLESGAPYIVMEFLRGTDFERRLEQEGVFPIQRAIDHVLQAAEALAEAHALGIVHRDLKPANLFVTRRADGTECVKVLDFGISKFTDPGAGADQSLTKTSAMLGSPLYMSPEHLRSSKSVDVRTDIWALGVILFEIITGKVPFTGESIAELCVAVLGDPLPKMESARGGIPVGLQAVIEKATAKEVGDRYANVGELAAALAPFGSTDALTSTRRIQRVLNAAVRSRPLTDPPPARPKPTASGAQTFNGLGTTSSQTGRRPLLVGGIALVTVLAAVGLAVALSGGAAEEVTPSASATLPDAAKPLAAGALGAEPPTAASTTASLATTPPAGVAPPSVPSAEPLLPTPSVAPVVTPPPQAQAAPPVPRTVQPKTTKSKPPPVSSKPPGDLYGARE